MRLAACVLFAVVLLSAALSWSQQDPNVCDCYSYIYVSPADGSSYAYAHSEFVDPNGGRGGCDYYGGCFQTATADLTVYEDGNAIFEDDETDNLMDGAAEADYWGDSVWLNTEYSEDGYHYVDGEYEYWDEEGFLWQGEAWDEEDTNYYYDVPAAPSITANYIDATYPTTTAISYTVSPAVLYQATVEVAGQYSTSQVPVSGYPNFYFDETALPDTTSNINFYGYMYGWTIVPPAQSVTRAEVVPAAYKALPLITGGDTMAPQTQTFALSVYEPASQFSYSLPVYGTPTISKGGVASMSTDQCCGGWIASISGSNSICDAYGNCASDTMYPPSGETVPPQGDGFRSVNNYWTEYFAPQAQGYICVSMIYETNDGAQPADFGCPGVTLP